MAQLLYSQKRFKNIRDKAQRIGIGLLVLAGGIGVLFGYIQVVTALALHLDIAGPNDATIAAVFIGIFGPVIFVVVFGIAWTIGDEVIKARASRRARLQYQKDRDQSGMTSSYQAKQNAFKGISK